MRARREDRLAQILDEGLRLLGERGFYGFTVQALAQRCGISNAGLLHHFASKDDILIAVLDELERREAEAFQAHLFALAPQDGATPPSRVAIRDFMLARVKWLGDRPDHGRFIMVLQSEALDQRHPAHAWFRKREDTLIAVTASLLSDALPDRDFTARLLHATTTGLVLLWLRSGSGPTLLSDAERAIDLILGNAASGGQPAPS